MNTSNNKWYSLFLFKGSLLMLMLLLVCLVISAYLGMLTPKLISNLSTSYEDTNLFSAASWALFYNFILVYINRVIYQLAVNKYVRMLIQYARTQTYGRWLMSSQYDSEKYPQGEILSRIMSDTESIKDLITSGSFGIFIDLCFVFSCLVGFIELNAYTGYFIGVTEVVATLLLIWGSQFMRDIFIKLRATYAVVNRVTSNVIGGIFQIYYTNHHSYASDKCNDAFSDYLDKQNKANTMDAAYYAIAESLYPILLALIIFVIPHSGIQKAALIFAIVDLIQRSIQPIKEISGKIANVQRAITGIDRIVNFLIDMPAFNFETIKAYIFSTRKLLKMNVDIPHYAYPLRKGEEKGDSSCFELKNIKFSAKSGDLIGLVGLSGSGKSTLLNILAANILAPEAKITLELVGENKEKLDISIFDTDEYRREVSIVSQESHIFSESLIFNITMKRDFSESEMTQFQIQWGRLVHAIPYLKLMGIGIFDKVEPNKLSLGQRQLLAGVRACYLKKNVVFIDEISSALDSNLELALRKCMLLIQENSLTFIVAHRIETIIHSSNILVMDNGCLIDSGIHGDLIARSGVYKEFIKELSHS